MHAVFKNTTHLPNPILSCSDTVATLVPPNRTSLEVDVIIIFISNDSTGSKILSSTTVNDTSCDRSPAGMITSTLRLVEPLKV